MVPHDAPSSGPPTAARNHPSHAHGVDALPPTPEQARVQGRAQRILLAVLIPLIVATGVGLMLLWPHHVDDAVDRDLAGYVSGDVTMVRAGVASVREGSCEGALGSTGASGETCTIIVVDNPVPRTTLVLPTTIRPGDVKVGQQVRLYRLDAHGSVTYQFADLDRRAPLVGIVVLFALAIIAVARLKGALALVGLGFAMFMLWQFILPGLLVGHDPALIGLVGGSAIMIVALYTAHGFSIRTTTALAGTLAGLVLLTVLAVATQHLARLTGITSEDDFQLAASAPHLRLTSVVTAGIIMAGLGVLNDVTITQSSAVWELAATERRRRTIFARAMRIGRDHIASTVYTIAFATAGAAMGMLLLAMVSTRRWSDLVVTEVFSEEILRTAVAAVGLAAALPMTTAIAVAAVQVGGGFREPEAAPAGAPVLTPRRATADDSRFQRPDA